MSGPIREDETGAPDLRLLHAVAKQVPCAFAVLAPDGTPLVVSSGARDLLGPHHAALLAPTGPAGPGVAAALVGRTQLGVPLRLDAADGPITLTTDFLPVPGGALVRLDACTSALAHRRFFQNSLDLLCVADHDMRLVSLSPSWTDCLGWSLDEMLGRPFLDFVHPDDRDDTRREAERLAANEEVVHFENRYLHRDGTHRWFQWNAVSPAGGPVYAVARDVTDQRNATTQLNAAYEALHDAEQGRLRLFQHVVHDIATPLFAMGLQLTLLESGGGPRDIQRLRQVHEHLKRLVDDVRDLSLAESRQLRLHRTRTPAPGLLAPTLDALQVAAEAKSVHLTSRVEEVTLDVDPLRFNQIVYNLVTNALKFTPPGGHIHVTIGFTQGVARLTVEDDGDGLDADDVERLFQPFVQLHDGDGNGSGLGLHICRQLVDAHGGRIWAESAGRGEGSRFHVEFPA